MSEMIGTLAKVVLSAWDQQCRWYHSITHSYSQPSVVTTLSAISFVPVETRVASEFGENDR